MNVINLEGVSKNQMCVLTDSFERENMKDNCIFPLGVCTVLSVEMQLASLCLLFSSEILLNIRIAAACK